MTWAKAFAYFCSFELCFSSYYCLESLKVKKANKFPIPLIYTFWFAIAGLRDPNDILQWKNMRQSQFPF